MWFIFFSFIFAGEGTLVNNSGSELYCYNSTNRGCIDKTIVYQFSKCIGDAMGTESSVYKIPDDTFFVCENDGCSPSGKKSAAIFYAARVYKGKKHYGSMSMDEFQSIMGNKDICEDHDEFKVPVSDPGTYIETTENSP